MHPQARREGLLLTTLPGGEVVVYDVERESYEHLSATCGCVWQHCDGATPIDRLTDIVAETYGVDEAPEIVELALSELRAGGLLADASGDLVHAEGISRRDALQRLATRGVAAAMLPVITTFAVPRSAAAQVGSPPPPPPPPPGPQGCTPGYWQTHNDQGPVGTDAWGPTGYSTGTLLVAVFTPILAVHATKTLYDALNFMGGAGVEGGAEILLRAGVAALLNASHPDVAYPLSPAAVITQVNAALASGSRDIMIATGEALDVLNNASCPL